MMNIETLAKKFLGSVVRYTGFFNLIKYMTRNHVTILIYHDPQKDALRTHLKFLQKHYNFIEMDTLVQAIEDNNWSLIPPHPLILTIDDGFKANFLLIDLLKHYRIKPTIYLCSHIINTNRRFWFQSDDYQPHPYFRLPNDMRLSILFRQYEFEQTKAHPTRQALNLGEMQAMAPFVDFQCHSKFHPVLPKCSEEEMRAEISESKQFLAKMLHKDIVHFSYPNGDYTEREIKHLKSLGYKSARTCHLGWNGKHCHLFRLKAMGIDDRASLGDFILQLVGISGFIRFAKDGSFSGKHPQFT